MWPKTPEAKRLGAMSDNIELLTVAEHAEAHRLLWENFGCLQDKIAWKMLSGLTTEAGQLAAELGRQRAASAQRTPEFHIKQSVAQKIAQNKPAVRARARILQRLVQNSPTVKARAIASAKASWANPEIRAKRMSGRKKQKHTAASRALMSLRALEVAKDPRVSARRSASQKASWSNGKRR